LLHAIAAEADDDEVPGGDFVSVYEEEDIDDVLRERTWSVEHVVPRSHVNGAGPGDAEDDPLGWDVATRRANGERSNLPLVLWAEEERTGIVEIDGEVHFSPPKDQRARLARKWLFVRKTYGSSIRPPSTAQTKRFAEILDLVRNYPVRKAEKKFHSMFKARYGWSNPLLGPDAMTWLDSESWREVVDPSTLRTAATPRSRRGVAARGSSRNSNVSTTRGWSGGDVEVAARGGDGRRFECRFR
jgi:hypothetical protein